ncbi:MAG: diaminopimelate epimerase, partial [Desulfovibrionaceae bacterium]|nr:diaminopimelate epimerase [Desulfovibrionaceae bacterium]
LLNDAGRITGATVDMGEPILASGSLPLALPEDYDRTAPYLNQPFEILGRTWMANVVSMGNPHNVLFLGADDPALEDLDLEAIGPRFENDPLFPERVNTEFVRVESVSNVSMRVWERGSGETMACGTGACATAVACISNGLTDRTVDVRLKGGTLRINWNPDDNHVYMTGPAVAVFDGVIEY